MSSLTVVLGQHPHTALLRGRDTLGGRHVEFPRIEPVHDAFGDMIREQAYDISEMAIVAFLQAFEAGRPISLLPVVMVGGRHHGSILHGSPEPLEDPRQLEGRSVGVRAYSVTTGMWVRGILSEDYGVDLQRITWVTTEASHLDGFADPPNVTRTSSSLVGALRSGELDAVILGGAARTEHPDLTPVLPDADAAGRRWCDAHGFTPVNHLVCTRRELITDNPSLILEAYSALADGLARYVPPGPPELSALRHGTGELLSPVALAARYAFDQGLISRAIEADEIFADAVKLGI